MADSGAGWFPYSRVLSLFCWGRDNYDRLDGELLLAGGRGCRRLTLREFVNVTYAYLAKGRDEKGLQELEMALAPPEVAEAMENEQNMQAMQQLAMMSPPKKAG